MIFYGCYILDAENKYSHLLKLVLSLIYASTKLCHCFETRHINVKTIYPVKNVMRNPEMLERIAKWFVQLTTYNLRYETISSIISQSLANFMADFNLKYRRTNEMDPLCNEVEYEALILSLQNSQDLGIKDL